MSSTPKEIAARLLDARKEAGMTQEELGDLVGVSTRSIAAYEAADVVPWRHMKKLSQYLGKPVAWLIHGDEAETAYDTQLERLLDEMHELRKEMAALRENLDGGGQKPPPQVQSPATS